MLKKHELEKIKEHLEKSQNPLFFFDNDTDGLCSFLLLQRAISRGKGFPIRSFPELDKNYLRKVDELNPDYVFILDKPRVSREFIEVLESKNIPIVWIDHHDVQMDKDSLKKTNYFNSKKEPVSYICYKIYENKRDLWLAMIGCIADAYIPDFSDEFENLYPELFNSRFSAFDALYLTELGKIIQILNFALKDSTTNTMMLIKFLFQAESPYSILNETHQNKQMHRRYNQLAKAYKKILEKAEKIKPLKSGKMLFFTYSGETSMSSEISNSLYFNNKDKLIVVAYRRYDKINLSIRGKNARSLTLKALKNIKGATGGGHEEACGAQLPSDKLEEFKENLLEII